MIVRNFVKMHHYETSNRPSICVVDKFLSRNNFSNLSEFAEECQYRYGEKDDSTQRPTGMTYDLLTEDTDEEDQDVIDLIHGKILEKFPEMEEYKLDRMYINCFAPRELANFHQDCEEPLDCVTFLLYANPVFKGLDEGGTTEFYLEEKLIAIPPIPNTLVKFTGWIWHRATPYNTDHRFTYAIKYTKDY